MVGVTSWRRDVLADGGGARIGVGSGAGGRAGGLATGGLATGGSAMGGSAGTGGAGGRATDESR